MRPPVDNRLKNTSSWANFVTKRDRRTPEGWQPGLADVEARAKLAARTVRVTASCPLSTAAASRPCARSSSSTTPWVDAVNATDNTAAHAHASHVAVAIALQQLGMEPILQVVCRDKNRLAIQADIVGAALHGVENICCLTGDDVTAGDEQEARRVFDLDGPQLIVTAAAIARGQYLSGRKIEPAAAPVHRRGREPGRAAARAIARARAQEGARGRALPAAADRIRARASRGVLRRGGARRALRAHRAAALDLPRRGAPPAAFMDARCRASRCPQRDRARQERRGPRARKPSSSPSNRRAHALAQPGVRGLHLISFRKDDAVGRLCERLGIPPTKERDASGHGSTVAV